MSGRGCTVRALLGSVALLLMSAGCQAGVAVSETAGSTAVAPRADAMAKAVVRITPTAGDKPVRLDERVAVTAKGGLLTDVVVTRGKHRVPGEFDPERSSWTADGGLAPDSTYQVRAEAVNAEGARSAATETFRTMDPAQELGAEITPDGGETVGIGMPVVVTFDEPVTDKAAVEKRLEVRTSERIEGGWHWFTDTEVHYRPKEYWPAHTDVEVRVNTRGVHAGDGVWGVRNSSAEFRIGRSVVTEVDLNKHQAKSYVNGKLKMTAPVTGGKPGWETRNGTKLIIGKELYKRFTNDMIGAPEQYDLLSPYALRITHSGEFIHTANWSLGSHGVANVSHGCVGMNTENSKWLYENTQYGDPVEMITNGPEMEPYGNGFGDWNLSWKEWTAGSALAQ